MAESLSTEDQFRSTFGPILVVLDTLRFMPANTPEQHDVNRSIRRALRMVPELSKTAANEHGALDFSNEKRRLIEIVNNALSIRLGN